MLGHGGAPSPHLRRQKASTDKRQYALARACCTATLISVACAPARAAPCDTLRGAQIPNTTIVAVALVDSGTFVPPLTSPLRNASADFSTELQTQPAFCRVEHVARPAAIRAKREGFSTRPPQPDPSRPWVAAGRV